MPVTFHDAGYSCVFTYSERRAPNNTYSFICVLRMWCKDDIAPPSTAMIKDSARR